MQGQMIRWNTTASTLRTGAPVILSGKVLGGLRKMFSVSVEQRDCESDYGVSAIVQFDREADAAVSRFIDIAADLYGFSSAQSDHLLSQFELLIGFSAQAFTIAKGRAAASLVLNSHCRTAQGSDGRCR